MPRLRLLGEILVHAIERCRADLALKESERRYRLLAENARDVIFTMDNNYRFTYISPSILHLRGVTPEEAMEEKFTDTLTPSSHEIVRKIAVARMEVELKGKMDAIARLEIQQRRKDGSLVWVEVLTSAHPGRKREKGRHYGDFEGHHGPKARRGIAGRKAPGRDAAGRYLRNLHQCARRTP